MNMIRAHKIAEAFSPINSFAVDSIGSAVLVNYLGNKAYFWTFAYNLGHVNHEEGQVVEIEQDLAA